MTTFGGYLSTADDEVFLVFGQSATYNDPDGGDATSITVVLGDISAETETDDVGRRAYFSTECLITLTDIATPDNAISGTITVGSDTWNIAKVLEEDENAANYEIWRDDDNRRHSEQQYRRTV